MPSFAQHIDFSFIAIVSLTILLIVVFYPLFGFVNSNYNTVEAWSNWLDIGSQAFLAIISFAACYYFPYNRKSSLCNGISGTLHVLWHYQDSIPYLAKNGILIDIVANLIYSVRFWSAVLIINEYFMQNDNTWIIPVAYKSRQTSEWKNRGENYLVEDPGFVEACIPPAADLNYPLVDVTEPDPIESAPLVRSAYKDTQREQTLLLFLSLERTCLGMILICTVWTYSSSPWYAFSAALLVIQILKVQKAVSYGASLFSHEHSHGLVVVLLIGGLVGRLLIDLFLLAPFGTNAFFGPSAELLTFVLPVMFHYFNIFCYHKKKPCNAGKRMKWCSVIMLVQANIFFVVAGLMSYSYGMPALVVMSRAAAWASAINLAFSMLTIISPVLRLLFQLFNFNLMHHAFHSIHFHRNTAMSGLIFGVIHILLILVQTKHYTCQITLTAWKQYPEMVMDLCASQSIISGIFLVLGMAGAGFTGFLSGIKSNAIISTLHFPFASIICFAIYTHGHYTSSIYPFGSYFVLATFLSCLTIYAFFFFFNPIQPMSVDRSESVWLDRSGNTSNEFAFLVVNFHNSSTIPPGSFFLLYSTHNSSLDYFHAHSFPVFSTQNRRVSFLVRCRIPQDSNQISFTQRLSMGPPSMLRLQGPFQGTTSSFINYLNTIHCPVDVYLCGWDAGVANIFSILEYLKDSAHLYQIQSICCLFNELHDPAISNKTHSCFNNLVRDWRSPKTVVILESENRDLNEIHNMTERSTFANKDAAMRFWRRLFPNRACWIVMRDLQNFYIQTTSPHVKRDMYGQKVLYFCGSRFRPEIFPYPEWRSFVETIP